MTPIGVKRAAFLLRVVERAEEALADLDVVRPSEEWPKVAVTLAAWTEDEKRSQEWDFDDAPFVVDRQLASAALGWIIAAAKRELAALGVQAEP